ncbi:MAG: sphingosine kinase [Spirochaetales bacterium]|nr:sphingosine kinase [Spirochaetales bacterium]
MMQPAANPLSQCTFLINPTRHPSSAKVLKNILKRETSARVIETKSREHFHQEVIDFCQGPYKYLVIWGGDGTVHDAINALMVHPSVDKALGFLRGGSGNGIQDSYEIPRLLRNQIKAYIDSIRGGYIQTVDLLQIETAEGTYYGQLVGHGFDVKVLKHRIEKKTSEKKGIVRTGFIHYVTAGIHTFFHTKLSDAPMVDLKLNNGKYSFRGPRINVEHPFSEISLTTQALMIEIGTRPYYGKMFKVCPDVVCNDGYLDVYLYNFADKSAIFRNLFALWNGWHHRINSRMVRSHKPIIERYEAKSTEIKTGGPFDYHIDGELYHTEADAGIKISIIPEAISFLVPRSFYFKFRPYKGEKS